MRTLLFYLAFLNLMDALLTFFGLHFSYITESNPLMNSLYDTNPVLFLCLKITLSILLMLFCTKNRLLRSGILKKITVFATILYTFVFLLHGYWLYSYFL
ncbi:DUF5658 family protein [Heyndrickxia shackletonii]|uniref:DUF5658 family protein n=1 Tax=Heyndrickxia TaxID=2837504 RepID=UPI0006EBFBB5